MFRNKEINIFKALKELGERIRIEGLTTAVLFLWQGSIYMLAQFIEPFSTLELLQQVSIIGGILILSIGINILGIGKIKTIKLIPSLFVPALYYFLF